MKSKGGRYAGVKEILWRWVGPTIGQIAGRRGCKLRQKTDKRRRALEDDNDDGNKADNGRTEVGDKRRR